MLDVERIEANLGIGKGSAIERRVTVDTLRSELYFSLDEQGKNRLDYLTAAAYSDARTARELVPLQSGLRPPQDLENALLENQIMVLGGSAKVIPNQNHMVHAQAHAGQIGELNQSLIDQSAPLEEVIPKMQVIQAHALEHMQFVNQQDPQAASLREVLNEFNEVIMNGAKQVFAQKAKMQREMEHNFPDGQQPPEAGGVVEEGAAPQDAGASGRDANSATLVQAAQAAQKIRDMNLITMQKLQSMRSKDSRDDALAAAKILSMRR